MDLKEIRKRIARLEELAAAWENEGRVDTIEKDIALGLLREIYGELRFGESPAGSVANDKPASEPVAEAAAAAVAGKTGTGELVEAAPGPEVESMPEPVAEPVVEPVAEPVVEPVAEPEPMPEIEPEPVAGPAAEPLGVPVAEPLGVPVAESASEPALPEAAKEPEQETPQKPVIPRRVDPDVIRSLYGSGRNADSELMREHSNTSSSPHSRSADNSDNSRNADSGRNGGSELMSNPANISPSRHSRSADNSDNGNGNGNGSKPATAKTTLADTMGEGRHTLGESLRNGQKDMASKIASSDKSTLRTAIGLNDRFLMIRDMFEGDARAFDEAIAVLDGFTDLDEAVIHIHETYEWNADCEGVKLLVELLERKLG